MLLMSATLRGEPVSMASWTAPRQRVASGPSLIATDPSPSTALISAPAGCGLVSEPTGATACTTSAASGRPVDGLTSSPSNSPVVSCRMGTRSTTCASSRAASTRPTWRPSPTPRTSAERWFGHGRTNAAAMVTAGLPRTLTSARVVPVSAAHARAPRFSVPVSSNVRGRRLGDSFFKEALPR